MENKKSYQQGVIDGIRLWGEVCGGQGNCETCPVGAVRGAGLTCQDFATKYPGKMVSILQEMKGQNHTFYNEYCVRFPECNLDIETLAKAACRKVVFEGYCACQDTNCQECWGMPYTQDVTQVEEQPVAGYEDNFVIDF